MPYINACHQNKYAYRCTNEANGALVAADAGGLKLTKSAALVLSREHDTEIRVQRQERGHNDWCNTPNLFRRGHQVIGRTAGNL